MGPEAFALAPFIDLANHSVEPNADFRLSQQPMSSAASPPLIAPNSAAAPDGPSVELIAIKDLQAGDEVLISYTGQEGLTNQRLMAQYGFVLPGGNPGDRVPFKVEGDAR